MRDAFTKNIANHTHSDKEWPKTTQSHFGDHNDT